MNDPTIIKVGFSASSGIGKAIREFTGGDVNHAFILYHDPVLDTEVTFGANSNGFTMVPMSDFPDVVVRVFTPMQTSLISGFRKNLNWINKPYDYAGLLGMSIVEFEVHILHWKEKNPFLDAHRLFCSEIATKIIRDSGYAILPSQSPGTIDPWMLCKALGERPDLFERRELLEDHA